MPERVNRVYALILTGGAALGSLLGGVFAHSLGITAPFWIAAAVMTLITAIAWHPLRHPPGRPRRAAPDCDVGRLAGSGTSRIGLHLRDLVSGQNDTS